MQHLHPEPAEQLALWDTGILRPLIAEVVASAIRRSGPDQLWQRIDHVPPSTAVVVPPWLASSAPEELVSQQLYVAHTPLDPAILISVMGRRPSLRVRSERTIADGYEGIVTFVNFVCQ